ncbi:MAG: hypothetical protein HOV76_32375 [Hamadaea sp.]|nr:hypothetical protein [Catenulispora sp.]NUT08174.1 hypothetical protein [Hamadaea sp.]
MSTPLVVSPVVQAVGTAIGSAMVDALADVAVLDAVDPMQNYENRSVTVGGTWDPDTSEFVTDQTVVTAVQESGASRHLTESTAIQCIAYTGANNDDFPGHRASVAAILAAIRSALRQLTSIDGASCRVQIADEMWAQGSDTNGTLAMAMFTVQAVRLL